MVKNTIRLLNIYARKKGFLAAESKVFKKESPEGRS